MADRPPRPRRIRILRTGWRLASAQVALLLALLVLVILGGAALLFPSPAMWAIAVAVPLAFVALGAVLFATCRYLVIDLEQGEVLLPGEEAPSRLADWRALVAVGQAGRAVTGSGRPYRYEVYALGALTDAVGSDVLALVEEARRDEALPDPAGFVFLLEATTKGFVPLIDAASEARAEREGARLAKALGIPFVALPPAEPAPLAKGPPPPTGLGSAELPG